MATAFLKPQIQHNPSEAPAYLLLLWFFCLWPIYTTVNTKNYGQGNYWQAHQECAPVAWPYHGRADCADDTQGNQKMLFRAMKGVR